MQVAHHTPDFEKDSVLLKGIDDEETIEFLRDSLIRRGLERKIVLSVDNKFSIDNLPSPSDYTELYSSIVNLRKANDIINLTNMFCAINNRLELGGQFITCVETAELRKKRLYNKFPFGINTLYYIFDYLGKRVAPKLPILNKVYFFLTAGRNRVLTSVEVLGRMVYCGFKIVDTKEINNLLYIIVEKEEHKINIQPKKHGFMFKMQRAGYQGKTINVYKIRSMYAYSEYLQDYIYEQNQLAEGGKFKNDFRINLMGNILRKLWLDEIPMLYNWVKGDVKLVGVRPLSNQYLNLYTNELKSRRENFKPGLVPPYYADMPDTIEEIMESEMKYFDAYEKNPWLTDIQYFAKAFKNIVIKQARSK